MHHKYIAKHNTTSTRGWQVRVPTIKDGVVLPFNRQTTTKFFSKGKGTWKAALACAITWRDDYLRQYDALYLLDQHNGRGKKCAPHVSSPFNTSGIIGVYLAEKPKPSGTYYSYVAVCMEEGQQKNRTFAVMKYGEKEAFQLACRWRFELAGTLIVTDRKLVKRLPDNIEYLVREAA